MGRVQRPPALARQVKRYRKIREERGGGGGSAGRRESNVGGRYIHVEEVGVELIVD